MRESRTRGSVGHQGLLRRFNLLSKLVVPGPHGAFLSSRVAPFDRLGAARPPPAYSMLKLCSSTGTASQYSMAMSSTYQPGRLTIVVA